MSDEPAAPEPVNPYRAERLHPEPAPDGPMDRRGPRTCAWHTPPCRWSDVSQRWEHAPDGGERHG